MSYYEFNFSNSILSELLILYLVSMRLKIFVTLIGDRLSPLYLCPVHPKPGRAGTEAGSMLYIGQVGDAGLVLDTCS